MTTHYRSKDLGTVLVSIDEPGGHHCVDLFELPNGTFGFELYRRDVETGEGWFPVGFYSGASWTSFEEAKIRATDAVAWLELSAEGELYGL